MRKFKVLLLTVLAVFFVSGSALALTFPLNDSIIAGYNESLVYESGDKYTFGDYASSFTAPLTLEANHRYTLDFTFGATVDAGDGDVWEGEGSFQDTFYIEALLGGVQVGYWFQSVTREPMSVVYAQFDFTVFDTPPTDLVIRAWAVTSSPTTETWKFNSANLDGGSTPVPEPATMLLFGMGLLGLAGITRRKAQA